MWAGLAVVVMVLASGCTAADLGKPTPSGPPVAVEGAYQGSGLAACPQPTANQPTSQPANKPVAGGALPPVSLECMDGSGRELRLDRGLGRPTVLNLWASWCGPCAAEVPTFTRLHQTAGNRLNVLGVSTQDSPDRAVASARDIGLRYPTVADQPGRVLAALGRRGLPVTVFVAADGTIRGTYVGAVLTDSALAGLVTRYLGVVVR